MNDVRDYMNINNLWRDFERELIYRNRFFPKTTAILERIDKIISRLTDTVKEESEWYRAREYEIDDPSLFHDDYSTMTKEEKEKATRTQMQKILITCAKHWDKWSISTSFRKFLSDTIAEKEKSKMWGYSEKESGIPPRDKAGLNRASPRYIAYLYLARDVNTALAEIRAQVGQPCSVAKYKFLKPLNIINFRRAYGIFDVDDSTAEEWSLCVNICNVFSSPLRSNEKDYIVSQYIAEYIKTLGYEGIAFGSSRNRGGINLTLFDDSVCEFLGTEIHEVTEIKVASSRLLPPKQ